jgi:hypothetical protein
MTKLSSELTNIYSNLIAWLWISIVLDRMPCFLGVPNCD